MPTEGTEVFAALQRRLRRADAEVDHCQAEAAALDAQLNDLLARRGEALLGLARHFLPEISRPVVEATFEGIKGDLLTILARKETRQRELTGQLDAAREVAAGQESELDDLTARLNALVDRRGTLEAEVAAALKADPDFQERSRLALLAEQRLQRDEQRAAEVREEAAEKLPHYDRSALFRYLHDRGHGTEDDRADGLVKKLDRWVARLIDYPRALNGYRYLRETPALVDAEVARRRGLFDDLMRQVVAVQSGAAERAGLTAVINEGESLGARRDALVAAREPVLRQIDSINEALAELSRHEDQFYREAIERFRDFLATTRLAVLEQRARQTPDPADDEIVAGVASLNEQIEGLKGPHADLAGKRASAVALRDGLSKVVRRFRQAEFDASRSYFPDEFGIREWLRDLEAGTVDPETLWASIRRHQRFRPHWIEPAASGASDVLSGTAGRVLMGAVFEVANAAMRDAAVRGVQRRGSSTRAPAPSRTSPPSGPAPRAPSQGGFTSGDGF